MHTKLRITISFLFTFLPGLLALVATILLSMWQRDGVIPFLAVGV